MKEQIDKSIYASLVADSYCLGVHWIYDEMQLKEMTYDWGKLNAPVAVWHEGKRAGDFTHYGDQTVWLVEYVKKKTFFDVNDYAIFWQNKMRTYRGYKDNSTKQTLIALEDKAPAACGPNCTDLSIVGRIAPLLYISKDAQDFNSNTIMFAKMTHNGNEVLSIISYSAAVLYDVLSGVPLLEAVHKHKDAYGKAIRHAIDEVEANHTMPTVQAIRHYGNACSATEGFKGVLHTLINTQDFKEALSYNAQAGGDSAARGMIIGMLLGASGVSVPQNWLKQLKHMPKL